jgi:hypothetical protein
MTLFKTTFLPVKRVNILHSLRYVELSNVDNVVSRLLDNFCDSFQW